MRDTFVKALLEEAKRDPNIFLITGDLGFGVLEEFEAMLPSQFLNAGVAEQTMIGLAAGIASTGKRVFVYSIGNFATIRALEQIRNDVCYMNNSVVIVSVGAGYSYGSQGFTHHALEDIATMRALPKMNVISPADPFEAEVLTRHLVADRKPSYFRLGRSGEQQINQKIPKLVEGRLNKIIDGKDGTILFTGSIGVNAIRAREMLTSRGLFVGVYSVPFVSQIDPSEISLLSKKGPLVVLEEHSIRGGLTSAILEKAAQANLELKVIPVASMQNDLTLIGDQAFLREENGIGVQKIFNHFIGA
jgi:transketolase